MVRIWYVPSKLGESFLLGGYGLFDNNVSERIE